MTLLLSPYQKIVAVMVLAHFALASCSKKDESSQAPLQTEQAAPPLVETTTPAADPNLENSSATSEQMPNEPVLPRDKVRERFSNLFGDLRHPTITTDNLRATWSEYWIPEMDEPLSSATDSDVAQGHRLAQEVDLAATPTNPLHEQINAGTVTMARNPEEAEAIIALYTLCLGSCSSGGRELPTLLNTRAQQLPPTHGDVIVFQILTETLPMVGQQAPMSDDQAAAWMSIANAPNPIYRLVALQAFARVSVDREQRLAFYRQYFNESEPLILKQLIDCLEALPSSQVPNALADLQAEALRTGKSDIGAYAMQALDRIQSPQ
jgi:hypothetical protein